jgi:uncharacterized protein (TIGR00299 family) protein
VKEGHKDRHLPEILGIIERASLSNIVKERAGAVFQRLAEAEAAVHGITPDKVHFHEVGALDAIADIVGAAVGLELLEVEKVYVSALTLGKGQVKCRHGLLPLPAPAVLELLEGYEVTFSEQERELTTPTGAALMTTLAEKAAAPPAFRMKSVGYGFGTEEGEGFPNALRVMTGRLSAGAGLEEVTLLETNLDDVTGELAGHLMDRCFEEGALDAFAAPVQMKKSRPGLIFSVLVRPEDTDRFRNLVHAESGSLGVRIRRIQRSVLEREILTLDTSLGPVRVKKAVVPGWPHSYSPEYEDAARIAREKKMPLRLVLEKIMAEIHARPPDA